MAHIKAWESLANISADKGEYFPDLNLQVDEWNKEEEKFIKDNLTDSKKSVLDLGCGDGRALAWLKENGFKNLYGLDISKICIARAKERLGATAKLTLGDYTGGFPYNRKFDRILLMGNTVIADLKEPSKLIKTIKNGLGDDGLLFITCWNGKFLTKEFFDSYYGKLGLAGTKIIDVENRTMIIGEGIVNKWLLEDELKKIIEAGGLKIKQLRKASIGFLCIESK